MVISMITKLSSRSRRLTGCGTAMAWCILCIYCLFLSVDVMAQDPTPQPTLLPTGVPSILTPPLHDTVALYYSEILTTHLILPRLDSLISFLIRPINWSLIEPVEEFAIISKYTESSTCDNNLHTEVSIVPLHKCIRAAPSPYQYVNERYITNIGFFIFDICTDTHTHAHTPMHVYINAFAMKVPISAAS